METQALQFIGAPDLRSQSQTEKAVMHSDAPFPLTLTLSPAERELVANIVLRSLTIEPATALAANPPLPEGEGWGEGEGNSRL